MKRPIDRAEWEFQRLESRERSHLWRSIVRAGGVMIALFVVVIGLAGLKAVRKITKQYDRYQERSFRDSIRESRLEQSRPRTFEDSLDKIDLRKATVTGLRGYDGVIVPYLSERDTIERLLGRADSAVPSPIICNKTLLHYYGSNVIDIDSSGKSIVRTIDLFANPQVKVNAGQFVLSRTTTLEGFARRFPFSGAHKLPQGFYGLRPLRSHRGVLLHLAFDEQGRLAYVHYYTGC